LIRALWRLAGAVFEMLRGAAICAFVFPFLAPPARMRHVGVWSMRTLRRLGITLEVQGAPQSGPLLLVANHVSWLDILAIDAVQPARFVAKAEVHRWPLLGWMVARGGTLFVERQRRRDAMRVVHQMAGALRAGDHVAVFPEGTTTDGPQPLPFHANLLQAAVATHTPVQAVALRYADAAHRFAPAAAYVGETSLLQSAWWVVRAEGLRVHVRLLPARATDALDRRALAQALRAEIAEALG
jgi:1-acyl-sn-glycerol-3-phosphate acyltransferase